MAAFPRRMVGRQKIAAYLYDEPYGTFYMTTLVQLAVALPFV
ncbi:MAG: hypothetical protein M5U34_43980 [Chloroflexi bacterium]|nr:hypothetical protein [Chloroflexota bacterium]